MITIQHLNFSRSISGDDVFDDRTRLRYHERTILDDRCLAERVNAVERLRRAEYVGIARFGAVESQRGPTPYGRYTQVAGRRPRWFFGAALRQDAAADNILA